MHDGEKQVQYFVGDVIEMIDNTENEASCLLWQSEWQQLATSLVVKMMVRVSLAMRSFQEKKEEHLSGYMRQCLDSSLQKFYFPKVDFFA